MKLLFFAILFLLVGLGNFFVFQRLYNLFPNSIYIKIIFALIAILFTFSLLIVAIWGDYFPFGITAFLAKVGSSWLFILFYSLILIGLQEVFLLFYKVGALPPSSLKFIGRNSPYAILLIILILFFIFIFGFFNYKNKRRVYLNFVFDKANTVRENTLKGRRIRIAALSDLHLGYTIQEDELSDWVKIINKENPDIIVLVGDIIDSSLKAVNKKEIIEQLKNFKAKDGVYAVLGNHEYIASKWGDMSPILEFFNDANISLLRDEVAEIGNSFYIVGRDDKTNIRRKSLKQLTNDLDNSKAIISLDHQPYHLEETEVCQIDLQISGHTHQGQIWPVSLLTKEIYEKDHGLLKKGNSNIYISSGIGIWGGKFRLGTNSEFVIIDIIPEN